MDWNERLGKWADAMEQQVAKVSDFTSAEVPEYVRELILWNIVQGIGYFVVMSVTAYALFRAGCWCLKESDRLAKESEAKNLGSVDKSSKEDGAVLSLAASILTFFLSTLSLACGLTNLNHAAKCYIAPRVVIVEKIVDVAKGVRK